MASRRPGGSPGCAAPTARGGRAPRGTASSDWLTSEGGCLRLAGARSSGGQCAGDWNPCFLRGGLGGRRFPSAASPAVWFCAWVGGETTSGPLRWLWPSSRAADGGARLGPWGRRLLPPPPIPVPAVTAPGICLVCSCRAGPWLSSGRPAAARAGRRSPAPPPVHLRGPSTSGSSAARGGQPGPPDAPLGLWAAVSCVGCRVFVPGGADGAPGAAAPRPPPSLCFPHWGPRRRAAVPRGGPAKDPAPGPRRWLPRRPRCLLPLSTRVGSSSWG